MKAKIAIEKNTSAQVTLEFTFCFLIVLLIFYSCVKALQWYGKAIIAPHVQQFSIHEAINPKNQLRNPADTHVPIRIMYRGEFLNTGY